MMGNRASGLSRAQNNSSTRKQLQYYESTPMAPKKRHPQTVKKQNGGTLKNTGVHSNLLDVVTGSNMAPKPHGKSSAYLNSSNSIVEFQ